MIVVHTSFTTIDEDASSSCPDRQRTLLHDEICGRVVVVGGGGGGNKIIASCR